MADGSADFTLRLRNQVSGPARAMSRSIRGLSADLRDKQRFFAQGETAFQRQLKASRRVADVAHRQDLRAMRQQKVAARRTDVALAANVFADVNKTAAAARIMRQRARGSRFAADRQQRTVARRTDVGFQRRQLRQRDAERRAMSKARFLEGMDQPKGVFSPGGFAALAAGVAVATAAVGALAAKFTSAAFAAVDFGQRTELALTALLGSTNVAREQFEAVRRDAQRFGLDVFETVDSFRKLLTAQFDVSTAREITQRTADLRALGSTADEVKFAVLAISQIKMKGKLQAEELTRQLANAGVSTELVYQELEKQLGKTRAEVLAMQGAGEIKADPAIRAILDAIGRKTGGKSAGALASMMASEKIGGMVDSLKAQFQNMFISLGQKIAPGLTKAMKTIMASINAAIASPQVAALGHSVVELFNVASAWAASVDLKSLITSAANFLSTELTAAADFIRNNGTALRDHFVMFVQAMGTGLKMAVDFFRPFVQFAASDFAKFLFTPLEDTIGGDGAAAVKESRARMAANARMAGQVAGTKNIDVRIGDIKVDGVEHGGNPAAAGAAIADNTHRNLMSLLESM